MIRYRRNKGKRALAALLSAALTCAFLPAAVFGEALEEPESEDLPGVAIEDDSASMSRDNAEIEEKTVPLYLGGLDDAVDIPLYFVNGVDDLPYISITDWADLLATIYQESGYEDYELYYETDGEVALYTRENDYSVLFDFEKDTITFQDYDAFIHTPGDTSLLDLVASDSYDDEGNPVLFERIEKGSFDRYGKEIEIDLAAYDISLQWSEEDGLYLAPLQTMGDLLLALPLGCTIYYNGEAAFIANENLFVEEGELTDLGAAYYKAPYGDLSEEMAWYSYCELCLALDYLYGLKEIHDIQSFDSIFTETGYREDLCSTDPNIKDGALNDFIDYYLDDLHSGFDYASYLTEEMETIGGTGLSSRQDEVVGERFYEAREKTGPGILPYEEVGNTAYITFDSFNMNYDPSEYYDGAVDAELEEASFDMDTIALIIYAHDQISREDSPIENVVIDLSLNGGGALDAAAFVSAWFLGEACMSIRSSLTGALSTGTYKADVNLDGVFDQDDVISDLNLFCLTSPYSFSCGNLVPNIFKSSRRVTLLGQESGGGSCSVLSLSTAYGSIFRISSPYRMSYLKNGSYYDIDTGIEPDVYIMKLTNFYDRKALTDYINNLF